ncbi:MAG: InlB B-repeat-containing protein [Christensenellaceae bacterium]|nr:InlB B-repeat-containing protein [Christensenellaceae bacterium]
MDFQIQGAFSSGTYSYSFTNLSVESGEYKSLQIAFPTQLAIQSLSSISTAIWNVVPTSGGLTLVLKDNQTPASSADISAILSSLHFTSSSGCPDDSSISVILLTERVSSLVIGDTIHFYEFVPANAMQWMAAYNAANDRTYKGLTGYLATITSAEEQVFIFKTVAMKPGWLGGTKYRVSGGQLISDAYPGPTDDIPTAAASYGVGTATTGTWYWACGPEKGLVFYNPPGWNSSNPDNCGVPGVFQNFNNSGNISPVTGVRGNSNQPDNNAEACLEFASFNMDMWNNLGYNYTNSTHNAGYYVEYSGPVSDVVVGDDTHTAPIPQPVTVEYADAAGNPIAGLQPETTLNGLVGTAYTQPAALPASVPAPLVTPPGRRVISQSGTEPSIVTGAGANAAVTGAYTAQKQTIQYVYYTNLPLNFDLNHLGHPANPAPGTVLEGAAYGAQLDGYWPAPGRPGYAFGGWFTSAAPGAGDAAIDPSSDLAPSSLPPEGVTLYAKWTAGEYIVHYRKDNGEAETIPDETVAFDGVVSLPSPDPAREGYTFLGWKVTAGGPAQMAPSGRKYGELAEGEGTPEITLTAQWRKKATPGDDPEPALTPPQSTLPPETIGPAWPGEAVPKTGDPASGMLWIGVLGLALCTAALLARKLRRAL